MNMITPARTSTKMNAAPITTIEPIVAPTRGIRSNTAMNTPRASEVGDVEQVEAKIVVTVPQISEITRFPAT